MCVIRFSVITTAVLLLSMGNASVTPDAAAVEEKPALIDVSNAPAAPAESVEARLALRQHREAAALNRFTFPGNILEGSGDIVEHWIVMFCPSWHDKCQGLVPSYELLGVQWENKLNKGLMSSGVRFAKVDCATDKALCVSLDIDDYPSVVHYRNQQRVASWHGGAPGLVRFVKQELEGIKPRPKRSSKGKSAAQPKAEWSCTGKIAEASSKASEVGHRQLTFFANWIQLAASPELNTLGLMLGVLALRTYGLGYWTPSTLRDQARVLWNTGRSS